MPRWCIKIPDKNGGFTFIEIIIAILVFSIISIPVFTVFSRIIRVTERIKAVNRHTLELVSLDDFLTNTISEIQFPFWVNVQKDSTLSYGKNHLEIPYWKGKENSLLKVDCRKNILRVTSPDETRIFKGWEEFHAVPLQNARGEITGIILIFKKREEKAVRTLFAFGSRGHSVFTGTEQ